MNSPHQSQKKASLICLKALFFLWGFEDAASPAKLELVFDLIKNTYQNKSPGLGRKGWMRADERRAIPARASACAPWGCIAHTPPSLSGGKRSRQNCLLANKHPISGREHQTAALALLFLFIFFTSNTQWRSVLTFWIFSALTRFGLARNRNAEDANINACVKQRKHTIVPSAGVYFFLNFRSICSVLTMLWLKFAHS